MKHYELLYLITSQLPETELASTQSEVSDWITKLQGRVSRSEVWGRKKLAYAVGKDKFGYYLLNEFDIEPEKIADLEQKLRLHKLVMRHLLLEKKPMTAKEMLEQEQRRAKAAEFRMRTAVAQEPAKVGVVRGERGAAPKKEKISLEELDKKLDQILDDNMIK